MARGNVQRSEVKLQCTTELSCRGLCRTRRDRRLRRDCCTRRQRVGRRPAESPPRQHHDVRRIRGQKHRGTQQDSSIRFRATEEHMQAKRGYVPKDDRYFSAESCKTLRMASEHICYLINKSHTLCSASSRKKGIFLLPNPLRPHVLEPEQKTRLLRIPSGVDKRHLSCAE